MNSIYVPHLKRKRGKAVALQFIFNRHKFFHPFVCESDGVDISILSQVEKNLS